MSPRTRGCMWVLGGVLVACLGLGGPACSSSGGPGPGSEDLLGRFLVQLVAPVASTGTPGYTSVIGMVYDGPTPSTVVWEEAARAGSCRLYTPRVPFCNTPCGGSAACVEDDVCQDYPAAQTVGTVTVTGLHTTAGAAEFTMDPIAGAYQPVGVTIEYPGFAEGDDIAFAAAGSDFTEAFTLQAEGILPFALTGEALTVESGSALNLSWTPPGEAELARIAVKLDISHHGGSRGKIECDAADSGSLELSADLITGLVELGFSGFPTIVVSRAATGAAEIDAGRVELAVTSEVEVAVEIPGLVSCNDDEDCPTGQHCDDDLACR